MASARWSKASAERHGVDDKYPAVGHVVADLLSLVLVRRGSRSENITVNKEDFVPIKALVHLTESFLPSAFKTERSLRKTLTASGKLVFGADFEAHHKKNGYYRTRAGTCID